MGITFPSLLVEVQTSTAMMKINMMVPQKLNCSTSRHSYTTFEHMLQSFYYATTETFALPSLLHLYS